MIDRAELLESALDHLPEGIALLGEHGRVVFWNRSAEAITGYKAIDLVGKPSPDQLDSLLLYGVRNENCTVDQEREEKAGGLTHAHHRLGYDLPLIVRILALRDGLGGHIGAAVVFHSAESLDALPGGECVEGGDVASNRAAFQALLGVEFDDYANGGLPFSVLWITVDQAHDMRRTHGANACEAMLEKVQWALAQGLRPAEKLGRWGDDEFLVLSHERTPEMLTDHAQTLAGMARTAEFRWWGDKVSLSVSIGAAQAEIDGSLVELLEQARNAMLSSFYAGGNQITYAPEGQSCSPS